MSGFPDGATWFAAREGAGRRRSAGACAGVIVQAGRGDTWPGSTANAGVPGEGHPRESREYAYGGGPIACKHLDPGEWAIYLPS